MYINQPDFDLGNSRSKLEFFLFDLLWVRVLLLFSNLACFIYIEI